MYMIHVLMNENYKLKEKMADMEKSQRYYEEGDSGGRKVSGSVPIVSYSVFAGLYSIVTERCLLLSTSGHWWTVLPSCVHRVSISHNDSAN